MSAKPWKPATERQRKAVSVAIAAARDHAKAKDSLDSALATARAAGVPILYLSDATGVARSRIRVLARDSER